LLSQYDDQLKGLENDLNNLSKQNTEIQLAIKKIKHDLERFNNDKENSHRLIKIMLKDYPWINEQKSYVFNIFIILTFKTTNIYLIMTLLLIIC